MLPKITRISKFEHQWWILMDLLSLPTKHWEAGAARTRWRQGPTQAGRLLGGQVRKVAEMLRILLLIRKCARHESERLGYWPAFSFTDFVSQRRSIFVYTWQNAWRQAQDGAEEIWRLTTKHYRHSGLLPVLVLVAVVDPRFSGYRDRAEVVFE